MTVQTPRHSPFSVIDFVSRTGFSEDSPAAILFRTADCDKENIRERLKDKVVFLGDGENTTLRIGGAEESGKIGFSLLSNRPY